MCGSWRQRGERQCECGERERNVGAESIFWCVLKLYLARELAPSVSGGASLVPGM
jgi:hypothetical protein